MMKRVTFTVARFFCVKESRLSYFASLSFDFYHIWH